MLRTQRVQSIWTFQSLIGFVLLLEHATCRTECSGSKCTEHLLCDMRAFYNLDQHFKTKGSHSENHVKSTLCIFICTSQHALAQRIETWQTLLNTAVCKHEILRKGKVLQIQTRTSGKIQMPSTAKCPGDSRSFNCYHLTFAKIFKNKCIIIEETSMPILIMFLLA